MDLAPAELVKTRCETKISQDYKLGSPGFGLRDNWFSARSTSGHFKAASYTFTYSADNGIRAWIDGVRIIDNWVDGGERDRNPNADGRFPHREGRVLRERRIRERRLLAQADGYGAGPDPDSHTDPDSSPDADRHP